MRCAKCGIVVLQPSMLDWGVNLPWIYMHCTISETYLVTPCLSQGVNLP